MTRNSQFDFQRGRIAVWPIGVFLVLALFICRLACSPASIHASHGRGGGPELAAVRGAAISSPADHSEVKSFFMEFAGDHSLDVATIIEQASTGYTRYTVDLHLASGAEQSVVVSAPLGGLEVEMHDMTGDHVPNDVILRPALLRWLPTVLVNDGHDHFAVAVSGTDPSKCSSNDDLGSRRRDTQTFACLTSGFKALHLPNSRSLLDPQLQRRLFSSSTRTDASRLGHPSSPGRAPPQLTAV